jgi:NhaC family Na+:H+ antiporter
MEIPTLLIFCLILILAIVFNISVVFALLAGLLLFCMYAKIKKYSCAELGKMIVTGIMTVKDVLLTMLLIGVLTAAWRACGTIQMIVCSTIQFVHARTFLLIIFLLNCGVSMLTGTSFGTAATMGVICMTMALSMRVNPALAGGAILSGAYFGDRCSPVSTSALLVSTLTQTNIFKNIKLMLRTCLLPFLFVCVLYVIIGFSSNTTESSTDFRRLFALGVNLHWSVLLPAIAILLLSLFKVNVKITMLVSIISAAIIALLIQHTNISDLSRFMLRGYKTKNIAVAKMLNGGGVYSMLRVVAIICIASAYAGIFQTTGLLKPVKQIIAKINEKLSAYGGIFMSAIITSIVACNQTLTIMLTHQLNSDFEKNRQKLAIALEDTAVVISPLVPWSIAGAVPLTTVGAPTASLLAAFFLYLLPMWRFIIYYRQGNRVR